MSAKNAFYKKGVPKLIFFNDFFLERFLPKNQYTQRKLLNFENWINGGLKSFQKSEF